MRSIVKYYILVGIALVPLIGNVGFACYSAFIDDIPSAKPQMVRSDDHAVAVSPAAQTMVVQGESLGDGGT
jgi:hypothetical protein